MYHCIIGDYYIGEEIIPVTIESAGRDESALSTETSVRPNGMGQAVYSVTDYDNQIDVYPGITAEKFLQSIISADYSVQTYRLSNAAGEVVAEDNSIEDGMQLTVTSENGQETNVYDIVTAIPLTDVELGKLGEVTFTAKDTSLQELQNHVVLFDNEVVLSQVAGIQDRYKMTILNVEENSHYSIHSSSVKQIFVEGYAPIIWRSFVIEGQNTSTNRTATVKKITDKINITSSEDVDVQFFQDGEWLQKITVDGVTIGTDISKVNDGEAKIVFTTTGTDLGEVDEYQHRHVKVKVNGIENNDSVNLSINRDGSIQVYISAD